MAQVRRSKRLRARGGSSYRPTTTIGTLPDNVLLEIFGLYRNQTYSIPRLYQHNIPHCSVWPWHLLVHVCRRWRQVVFESPLGLDLKLLCTHKTPVRQNLSIWPAFPIVIDYCYKRGKRPLGQVIAALKHSDRVCSVSLDTSDSSQLGKMAMVMRKPFPVLAHLNVFLDDKNAPILPAGFLGGSAPCLQTIHLRGISFPALPSLLLSASDLVKLELRSIPLTGYISPEAMVASLAALLRLETFVIEIRLITPPPDQILPPPVTRTILPALTYFEFQGYSEYLEDLVARIDGPQLEQILTVHLDDLFDIQLVQFSEFIDRSAGPESNLFKIAHVAFYDTGPAFVVYSHASPGRCLNWCTSFCQGIDWQVSDITRVLSQFSAAFSNTGHLKLLINVEEDYQLEGMGDFEWLHLLHHFSAVRTLHVSQELARHFALALEDITGEMVAEVLPSLDLICIEGQPASSLEKFVTARRLSGRPVTVVDTKMELNRLRTGVL